MRNLYVTVNSLGATTVADCILISRHISLSLHFIELSVILEEQLQLESISTSVKR